MPGILIDRLQVTLSSRQGPLLIFQDFSLDVKPGEFLTLLGPSGCGKTTLLRTLAGLNAQSRGKFSFVRNPDDPPDPRVLMVFQDQNLFPWMTVLENVTFGLQMQGESKERRTQLALPLLRQYGLYAWKDAYPHQLSQGMKQRAAVLHCFLSRPNVMLMDEPFASLDIGLRRDLHQELLDLWERGHQTILFVTHDVEEAIYLSDRIQLLSPRPASIVGTIEVRFERPRRTSLYKETAFLQLKARTVDMLLSIGNGEKSVRDMEL